MTSIEEDLLLLLGPDESTTENRAPEESLPDFRYSLSQNVAPLSEPFASYSSSSSSPSSGSYPDFPPGYGFVHSPASSHIDSGQSSSSLPDLPLSCSVSCPVCGIPLGTDNESVNRHIDQCLNETILNEEESTVVRDGDDISQTVELVCPVCNEILPDDLLLKNAHINSHFDDQSPSSKASARRTRRKKKSKTQPASGTTDELLSSSLDPLRQALEEDACQRELRLGRKQALAVETSSSQERSDDDDAPEDLCEEERKLAEERKAAEERQLQRAEEKKLQKKQRKESAKAVATDREQESKNATKAQLLKRAAITEKLNEALVRSSEKLRFPFLTAIPGASDSTVSCTNASVSCSSGAVSEHDYADSYHESSELSTSLASEVPTSSNKSSNFVNTKKTETPAVEVIINKRK
mmetsp:Transcript_45574/g.74253  ORF Transcript_45574/g.74253 Transcript_45574/m.74253 type:complete len:410 (-) Transcript_45574:98-1327(-)|eukprot:CAMPEP_0184657762 /NCGR_PEP_ID=MMETSP0308-20130426/21747_1 /TAXON_ID=38269 /ORGANISM="Gloeochaete witrockiana, Strain SAG 46.84" /LENGTH=409 /DNA_ID=CAMNT_0027096011 /DNA_START=1 /DNA_END=1230 /DNA_ORIENTATION=+